jgi:hypothetical protein
MPVIPHNLFAKLKPENPLELHALPANVIYVHEWQPWEFTRELKWSSFAPAAVRLA